MKRISWKEEFFLLIALVLISLALFGLDGVRGMGWLRRPVETFSNPLKKKLYQFFRLSRRGNGVGLEGVQIENKIESLEQENADLKIKLAKLIEENEAQRRLLGAPLSNDWSFIPAHVVGLKDGVIVLDRGQEDGVEIEQVVVFENILVGRVIELSSYTSKIILPINNSSKINALVLESSLEGIVSVVGGQLVIDGVLTEDSLEKDQLVVTRGKDDIYPSDLIIGKINFIEKKETEVYQRAVLKQLLDYQGLEYVFLIKR